MKFKSIKAAVCACAAIMAGVLPFAGDTAVAEDENNGWTLVRFVDVTTDVFVVAKPDSYGMIGMACFKNEPIYCIHKDNRSEEYGGIEDVKPGTRIDITFWSSGAADGVAAEDLLCIRKVEKLVKAEDVLYGDANCDGAVTIADCTIILQSIGNPDKYELSEEGSFNGDCFNTGDGITGLDALAIQKLDANIITSLPIEE